MEVVSGQVSDLEYSRLPSHSISRLKSIHRRKTAALLKACMCSSAIYLGAAPKQLKALTSYAEHLGLAFQIADDILDATSTRKQLGKPVKADIRKGFPYLVGLERSNKLADQEKSKAIAVLKIFGKKADTLREIAEFVVQRKT
jgi:geranylgeranyl diphosphate synthase type II